MVPGRPVLPGRQLHHITITTANTTTANTINVTSTAAMACQLCH
jgi:hypothetical protein